MGRLDNSLLKLNADRVVVQFAIDFKPGIDKLSKLPEAAEVFQRRFPSQKWTINPSRYLLRYPDERFLLSFEVHRFWFMSLGLQTWTDNLSEFSQIYKSSLDVMEIAVIKRIGFKVMAWVPLEMSHAEMVDLMFGSFLVRRQDIEPVIGTPYDTFVQIYSEYGSSKVIMAIAPVNADQAAQSVASLDNLEMIASSKLFDTGPKEFRDRVAHDSLLVDLDFFRQDIAPGEIPAFMKESLHCAGDLADRVVGRLKGLHARRRANDGHPK